MAQNPDAPNPPLPPPLLYAAVFFVATAPAFLVPLQFLPYGWNKIPAVLLCLGGLVIYMSAAFAFRKAGTSMSPYQPAKKLVVTGAYLRTRNPMYLGFAWMYLGFTCWLATLWPLLAFPVLIYLVDRLVIAREEAHLERRFGAAYLRYKAATRRWM